MKRLKKIPKFKNERAESRFWTKQDSADYLDWAKAKKGVFPDLKISSKSVPIRFPVPLLEHIKVLAHKLDVPYQSLIKTFLQERIEKEIKKKAS